MRGVLPSGLLTMTLHKHSWESWSPWQPNAAMGLTFESEYRSRWCNVCRDAAPAGLKFDTQSRPTALGAAMWIAALSILEDKDYFDPDLHQKFFLDEWKRQLLKR